MYTKDQCIDMIEQLPEWCKETLTLEVAQVDPKPRQPTIETAQVPEKPSLRPKRGKKNEEEPPKSKFSAIRMKIWDS